MTKQLLFSLTKKDFEIQTFRCGGPGGQNQNKVESGVRIIHPASGARAESRKFRTQEQNKKEAFRKLTQSKEFLSWHRIQCAKIMHGMKSIEEQVEDAMQEKNIKTEVLDGTKWKEVQAIEESES